MHTLSRGNFFTGYRVVRHRKHIHIDNPTASIDDHDSITSGLVGGLSAKKTWDANVKVGFALCQHVDTKVSLKSIGNEAGTFNRPKVEALLPSPASRISKNEFNGMLHRIPGKRGVTFLNVGFRTVEQILDEICENVDGRFSRWERG